MKSKENKENKILRRHSNKKYSANDDYFKVWSHNMAYILGFWFADGYMSEKTNTFKISQHKKDRYILSMLLNEMKSDSKILKDSYNNLRFCIYSSEIIKDLKGIGGVERKSLIMEFPKVPTKYLPDFIRGYWDGDGSIVLNKGDKAYVASTITGSKKFAYDLLDKLRDNIKNFRGTISVRKAVHDNYIIVLGVNDTRRLRDYMYSPIRKKYSNLFLKRKYKRFILAGNIKTSTSDQIFLSYDKAKGFIVKKLGLKQYREWREYKKEHNIENIPADLGSYYKNKGWINYNEFFDSGFWTFHKARRYVRKLNLKSVKEWRQYASSGKRPMNIPHDPYTVYKKPEWKGMPDFLGGK